MHGQQLTTPYTMGYQVLCVPFCVPFGVYLYNSSKFNLKRKASMNTPEPTNITPFRKSKKENIARSELTPLQELLLERLIEKYKKEINELPTIGNGIRLR